MSLYGFFAPCLKHKLSICVSLVKELFNFLAQNFKSFDEPIIIYGIAVQKLSAHLLKHA